MHIPTDSELSELRKIYSYKTLILYHFQHQLMVPKAFFGALDSTNLQQTPVKLICTDHSQYLFLLSENGNLYYSTTGTEWVQFPQKFRSSPSGLFYINNKLIVSDVNGMHTCDLPF
jgi:hypothetical protein